MSKCFLQRTLSACLVFVALLAGCGGGDDPRPSPASTGPIVGAPAPAERLHCPERTMPVPPGGDFSNRVVDQSMLAPGLDLRGANFDNATLINILLDKQDLTGATFRNARIDNVQFILANLTNTNFDGAGFTAQPPDPRQSNITSMANGIINNTCFMGASFDLSVRPQGPVFFGTALNGADFSYTNILDVPNFADAIAESHVPAQKAKFHGDKMPAPCAYVKLDNFSAAMDTSGIDYSSCPKTIFENVYLRNSSFDGVNLKGFSFSGANLGLSTFRNATFDGSPSGYTFDSTTILEYAVFTGATFRSIGFSGAQLEGADFSNVTFSGTDPVIFDHVFLRNAHFDHAQGWDVRFNSCYLPNTTFNGAYFETLQIVAPDFAFKFGEPGPDFSGATLGRQRGPDFSGLDLSGLRFDGAALAGAVFARTTLTATSFVGATGPGQDFRGVTAKGAKFDNASLGAAHFDGAALESASFAGAQLDGASGFGGTAATPARLSGTKFNSVSAVGVDFSNAQLYGADFTYADLSNTSFAGSFLTSGGPTNEVNAAKFNGARLVNANFANAKLQSVSFASANLYTRSPTGFPNATCQTNVAACGSNNPSTGHTCSCASMAGADLSSADFTGAYLAGVDFANSGTVVNGTVFNGAILIGANFDNVEFRAASGAVPTFQGAMLQGARIGANGSGSATLTLTGAYLDFKDNSGNAGGNAVMVWLGNDHTRFRNWSGPPRACVEASYLTPSVMPTRSTLDCPDGTKGLCGPVLPGLSSPSHWWNRTPLASATPAPGWYEVDASYENAVTDSQVVCGGNPATPGW